MRPFFAKYIINGGLLPGSCRLRQVYLKKYCDLQLIMKKINSQPIGLLHSLFEKR